MALNAQAKPAWETAAGAMLTGRGPAWEAASPLVSPTMCGHSTSSVNVRFPPGHAHAASAAELVEAAPSSLSVAAENVTRTPAWGSSASKRLTTGAVSPSAAQREAAWPLATDALLAGSTRSALQALPHTRGSPVGVHASGHASFAPGSPSVHAGGGEDGVSARVSWQTCGGAPL